MTTWLIRHAESEKNAVNAFCTGRDQTKIFLSEKGKKEAEELAKKITRKPDVIVVSKYPRTLETAKPLIRKFPGVPVEEWDVFEFTFLCPEKCKGFSEEELKRLTKDFFERRNDPDFRHGKESESFHDLMKRVEETLRRIDPDKFTLIFTHGNFMRAVEMYQTRPKEKWRPNDLKDLVEPKNTEIRELMI